MQVTNRFKTFYILSLLLFTLVSCQTTSPGGKSKRLFTEQGEDWEISETANWTFQDDELTGVSDAIGGYMATKAPYQNFKFKAEFYPIEGVNSGIFFLDVNKRICRQKIVMRRIFGMITLSNNGERDPSWVENHL
jgi:hypothetical protein